MPERKKYASAECDEKAAMGEGRVKREKRNGAKGGREKKGA